MTLVVLRRKDRPSVYYNLGSTAVIRSVLQNDDNTLKNDSWIYDFPGSIFKLNPHTSVLLESPVASISNPVSPIVICMTFEDKPIISIHCFEITGFMISLWDLEDNQ